MIKAGIFDDRFSIRSYIDAPQGRRDRRAIDQNLCRDSLRGSLHHQIEFRRLKAKLDFSAGGLEDRRLVDYLPGAAEGPVVEAKGGGGRVVERHVGGHPLV